MSPLPGSPSNAGFESDEDRSSDRSLSASYSHPKLASYDAVSTRLSSSSATLNGQPSEYDPLLPKQEESEETTWSLWMEELRIVISNALPIFVTSVLEYSLVLVTVISIGHIDATHLAASTLGSITAGVTGQSILIGLTSALDSLLPSAWTSPDPTLVGLWAQRMMLISFMVQIPILVTWWNAEKILLLLKQDPAIAHLASRYLQKLSFGLPAFAFNGISRRYFQSQGLYTVPTRIACFVAPVNAALNYLLVWGPEPIRIGFIGAPIATAASLNLIALSSLIYGTFFVPKTAWRPISRASFTNLGVVWKLGIAGVAQLASEWWAWEIVAFSVSMIGTKALSTHSVLFSSASTAWFVPYSIGVACSIRIGNLLGQEDAKRASISSKVTQIAAMIMAFVISSIFVIFRHSWGFLYTNDEEIVAHVASVIPLLALFHFFDGQSIVAGGILRARRKQVASAMLNLTSFYVIGIPLGLWLAFRWKYGLIGLWLGMTVAFVYGVTVSVYLVQSTDWDKEVEKTLLLRRNAGAERVSFNNSDPESQSVQP